MNIMNEKYRQAIEEAELLSKKILDNLDDTSIVDLPSNLSAEEASVQKETLQEYSAHNIKKKGVNVEYAWLKLWLRYNSKYMYTAASAAVILIIASLLIFIPANNNKNNSEILSFQEEIKPASGSVSLKLANGEIISIDSISSIGANLLGVDVNSGKQEISYAGESTTNQARSTIDASKIEGAAFNELTIPKGRSYSLVLSDGTRVWLNAESSIRYPVSFGKGERRVTIKGEAFFDVKYDAGKVFIAETENYNIKVLGTKFNVSTYSDEEIAAATLVSGSISISSNNNMSTKETMVEPGEQFRYNKRNKITEVTKVDTDLYTSWVDNNLRIKQMSLEEIFKILRRRYDIDVFYSDNQAKYEKFSGKIPLNDNLNIILEQISIVSKVEFQIENKLIVIRYKD